MENDWLPDYENPPVIEAILGVQFERLRGFCNAHLGAFWKALDNEDWPQVSDAPPLRPQIEQFAASAKWAPSGTRLMVTQDLSSRMQIKNRAGNRMIQVQNGRFHFNWLGQAGGQYPRYRNVRQGFLDTLQQFIAFVIKDKVGDFLPNQWEVTYLNHIPRGTVWNAASDWGFFLPLRGAVPTVAGLVQGESFSGGWHFVIPEKRGRLHIKWQHGKKSEQEEQEIIVLTFTARGPVEKSENVMRSILEGVNLGRETIVRSFAAFMSEEANTYWGIKHAID